MKTWCIVYWVEEGKVSVENLASVEEGARSVGSEGKIKFNGGKAYHGKVLKIGENKQELDSDQKRVKIKEDGTAELATNTTKATTTKATTTKSATTKVTANTKATPTTATTKATTKATPTTTNITKKGIKCQKIKDIEAAAKVQKELCKQMLNLQKDGELLAVKKENVTLKRRVAELENEVQQLKDKASTGTTCSTGTRKPSFSMEITPKKLKLLRELTSFVSDQVPEEHDVIQKRPLPYLPCQRATHPSTGPSAPTASILTAPPAPSLTAPTVTAPPSPTFTATLATTPIAPPTPTLTAPPAPTLTTPSAPTLTTPSAPNWMTPAQSLTAPPAPTMVAPAAQSLIPPPDLNVVISTPKASVSTSSTNPIKKQLLFATSGPSPSSHVHLEGPDETLVPLFPGGKPIITDAQKRQAFRKGLTKETLLTSLLEVVFGQETLARGKACGKRVAPNKNTPEETVPLDSELLVEIKECILKKFRTSTGVACLSPREFNEKINSKCASARRAIKNKK